MSRMRPCKITRFRVRRRSGLSKRFVITLAIAVLSAVVIAAGAGASVGPSLAAKEPDNLIAAQPTESTPVVHRITRVRSSSLVPTRAYVRGASAVARRPAEVGSNYWWGTQTWYSRSEVRAYASWWGVIGIAQQVCGFAPWQLRTLCNATVKRYTSWIYDTWMYAKNTNQCLTMKMTWTGQVIGINAYGCNWG